MKVFITGATGFLGRRVVDRLASAGHETVALVRDPAKFTGPETTATVVGSLDDVAGFASAMADCDAVIHLASLVAEWAPWSRYQKVVVAATAELIAEADRQGVRRFVFASSEAVMQDRAPLLDVDESHPMPARQSSRYGRAKAAAERAMLNYDGAIERVILRPPFIWGHDSDALARFVTVAERGKLPLFDNGAASFDHIHVDNAAEAMSAAVERGRDRGVYFVTNDEAMPVRNFLAGVLAAKGIPMPKSSVPSALLRPAATVLQGLWAGLALPGSPPITPFEVEFFSLPRRFNITAARQELGYRPKVSFEAGIARLADGSQRIV